MALPLSEKTVTFANSIGFPAFPLSVTVPLKTGFEADGRALSKNRHEKNIATEETNA
jgi:hypothetical protein